jgi:hypothetical protein
MWEAPPFGIRRFAFEYGGFLHGSFRAFAGPKGATTFVWWMANEMRMPTTQAAQPFAIHSPHDRNAMPPYTAADPAKIRHGF